MTNPIPPAIPAKPPFKRHAQAIGIGILTFVALCSAFYFGRELLIPIAFAVLLNAIFRPIVRWMERFHVPTTASAGIIVLSLVAILVTAGYHLATPASNWINQFPSQFQSFEKKFQKPLQQVSGVVHEIEHATQSTTTQPSAANAPASAAAPAVPAILRQVVGGTFQFVTALLEILFLLFLLLASGQLFLQKLVKVIPLWRDKAAAVQIVEESQTVVMRYIVLNAMVMACQGVVVSLVLWALRMPSPWLWGILTFLLELIPYAGAAVMIAMLTVAGFSTFPSTGHALLIPLCYFAISTLQSSVISPIAYGKRLRLNPVAVFVGVLFWFFLWGIPGAYLAVPIIATIKITCDRTQNFVAIGEFLGE